MKNKKIILLASTVCTIAIVSFTYYELKNNTNTTDYSKVISDLNNDGKKEEIILNDDEFKIMNSDGIEIYKENTNSENVKYNDVGTVKDKSSNKENIIVSQKTKDTSGMLTFSIYSYKDDDMVKVDSVEDVYKGIVEVKDNTIIESSPIYEEQDSNAVPSKVQKNYYVLEGDKLILEKTETSAYEIDNDKLTATTYTNPSYDEIESIIEKVAYEKGIPSAILKAVAWAESSWRQFYNGDFLLGYDGVGIGIMQVSDYAGESDEYINRLKYDIEFNISEGADIFLSKWSRQFSTWLDKIPAVGNKQPTYLEHWYFPIMAYNGYAFVNNPECVTTPYQKKVIEYVNDRYNTPMIDLGDYLDSTTFKVEETDSSIKYVGNWTNYTNENLSGGTAKYSINDGDYMEYSFYGFGVQLVSYKNIYKSIIKVTLDGDDANAEEIDLYSATDKFNQVIYSKTLISGGLHTIKIEITGEKNSNAVSFSGAIDAINILPSSDISEVTNANLGDVKKQVTGIKYVVSTSSLSIRNDSMSNTEKNFYEGDIVEITKDPEFYNGYYRYYVVGEDKEGWVAGNWLKPIGDVNLDNIVDVYDFVKISRCIEETETEVTSSNIGEIGRYDANMDGVINKDDITDSKENYNIKLYTTNMK